MVSKKSDPSWDEFTKGLDDTIKYVDESTQKKAIENKKNSELLKKIRELYKKTKQYLHENKLEEAEKYCKEVVLIYQSIGMTQQAQSTLEYIETFKKSKNVEITYELQLSQDKIYLEIRTFPYLQLRDSCYKERLKKYISYCTGCMCGKCKTHCDSLYCSTCGSKSYQYRFYRVCHDCESLFEGNYCPDCGKGEVWDEKNKNLKYMNLRYMMRFDNVEEKKKFEIKEKIKLEIEAEKRLLKKQLRKIRIKKYAEIILTLVCFGLLFL